ncbi:MAG TPA: FAD-binding oxidoreductase [Tepidiformaceae bacterium]|jgi:alkyldihydroxyacetonephosphate synthase
MTSPAKPRRSLWMFGFAAEEPTYEQRVEHAARVSQRLGVTLTAPRIPTADELELRPPRIAPLQQFADFCYQDNWERAYHSYGADRSGYAVFGEYPNPPDIVAHPRTEAELEALLSWCSDRSYCTIPYGGGSTVVEGVTPPADRGPIVSIDMDRFDRVLEIDEVSRAARIQAGVFGPDLEDQLRPRGYTLRHFPQSFVHSTLGGWIATRSGGHYATNHTHIDDFVESTRMLTPKGWWESRRLPGGGAGPNPDRLVIGSEGTLGIITEAWMRIQARPTYRATAGITFPSWEAGYEAARRIVQAKLWPANLRLLDPLIAAGSGGLDGTSSLLIVAFESSELSQRWPIAQAVEIARGAGGLIADDEISIDDGTGTPTGRGGAVGAWRDAFIPRGGGLAAGLGMVGGTFETAITWDRWPEFDRYVREQTLKALNEIFGGGTLNCRFTHVYTDGPAPYYTYAGAYRAGDPREQQRQLKQAASDAIMKAGGTITHHHAVGRQHRPWYDQERPDLFADALRAAKRAVDPNAVLNPGVLIDP